MEYLKGNVENNKKENNEKENNEKENNEKEIREYLQHIPICLVGEDQDVLVRANQLVLEMDKTTADELKPYLYRAPRHLGGYDKLLSVLEAQENPSFDQLAMVLREVHVKCKGEPMYAN